MATALIDGTPFHYEVHGNGAPLMLIAGLASDSQSWAPILEDLARRWRVIAYDNRGVGRTPLSEAPITIGRMAEDCLALADHLGLPSMSLLGHSMGGFIAIECALRAPERIEKLLLAGTSTRNSRRNTYLFSDWAASLEAGADLEGWFRNIFYWVFSPAFFENEEAVQAALQFELDYPYPINPAAFRGQVEAIAAFDCGDRLSRIDAPTLVIAGEEDVLIPPKESAQIERAIPGAAFCLIPRAAHAVFTENPKDFAGCVVRFLSD